MTKDSVISNSLDEILGDIYCNIDLLSILKEYGDVTTCNKEILNSLYLCINNLNDIAECLHSLIHEAQMAQTAVN